MESAPLPERVVAKTYMTPRLKTHVLTAGPEDGIPVCFVHGNVSSSRFWDETLATLPSRYRGFALDLRGFGETETLLVDATRGMRDFADDVHSLLETLGFAAGGPRVHLVGWSMGGGVVMQYAIDHPDRVASLVLVEPLSPYGFGGTKDVSGTLCWPDAAGSGGGTANPEYVQRLAQKDRSEESAFSPRVVMNTFYVKPPFRVTPEREEAYVTALLTTVVGEGNYAGDMVPSENWPGVGPGTRGLNNAMSPKYCNLSAFAAITPKPPVLWLRGDSDQIVSDTSLLDFGTLGQLGAVPGWPGAEVYPPQPMVSQMRAVLNAYRAAGGSYREEVVANSGHSPHIEQPAIFRELLLGFLEG